MSETKPASKARRPISLFTGAKGLSQKTIQHLPVKDEAIARSLANIEPAEETITATENVVSAPTWAHDNGEAEPVAPGTEQATTSNAGVVRSEKKTSFQSQPDQPEREIGPEQADSSTPKTSHVAPSRGTASSWQPEDWDTMFIRQAGQPVPNKLEDMGAEIRQLKLRRSMPVAVATLDEDSYQRLRHASARLRLPAGDLMTYLFARGLPRPTKAFAGTYGATWEGEKKVLRNLHQVSGAFSARWERPAWLPEEAERQSRERPRIRYFDHPYLSLRLAELEMNTGLRAIAAAMLIRFYLPPSPVFYARKQRRY
jgi:hypothetical protein